jgi:hypothetical protein
MEAEPTKLAIQLAVGPDEVTEAKMQLRRQLVDVDEAVDLLELTGLSSADQQRLANKRLCRLSGRWTCGGRHQQHPNRRQRHRFTPLTSFPGHWPRIPALGGTATYPGRQGHGSVIISQDRLQPSTKKRNCS